MYALYAGWYKDGPLRVSEFGDLETLKGDVRRIIQSSIPAFHKMLVLVEEGAMGETRVLCEGEALINYCGVPRYHDS